MELAGEVVPGMGRGADYVGMDAYQERFADALGFEPFPGTLNLAVDPHEKERFAEAATAHRIPGFEVDGETYSAVTAYEITVDGQEAALLEMELTDHPPAVAEIIAPVGLRDALDLDDGEVVTCRT